MPLGRYPNGNFKIYREEDLIFLLSTKKFDLIPDISTCVIWVNLEDCDPKVKSLLNLVIKSVDMPKIQSEDPTPKNSHGTKKPSIFASISK